MELHILRRAFFGVVSAALLAGGCTPTASTPAPSTAPQASAPSTPTSATATGSTPSPTAASVVRGANRFVIAPDASEARFRAQEQLVGRNLPSEAVGKTNSVSGGVSLDANGAAIKSASKIIVDLRTLKTDSSQRDGFIQQNTLQTRTYPNAEFVVSEIKGLPNPLPTSGDAKIQLIGDLTIHGVTKPATWDATVKFGGSEMTGTAIITTKMTDFGMTPPKVGPVLSIEDTIKLELDFKVVRDGV